MIVIPAGHGLAVDTTRKRLRTVMVDLAGGMNPMLDGLWLSIMLILAALDAGLVIACARLPGAAP